MAGLSAFLRGQAARCPQSGLYLYIPTYIIKEEGLSHNVRQSPKLPGRRWCSLYQHCMASKLLFPAKEAKTASNSYEMGFCQIMILQNPLPICPAGCQLPALTAPDLCAGHSAALRRQKLSAPNERGTASSKRRLWGGSAAKSRSSSTPAAERGGKAGRFVSSFRCFTCPLPAAQMHL